MAILESDSYHINAPFLDVENSRIDDGTAIQVIAWLARNDSPATIRRSPAKPEQREEGGQ